MNNVMTKAALLGDVWVLWVLLAASVLSVAVMVDRWLYFRRTKLDFAEFFEGLKNRLDKKEYADASRYARSFEAIESRVTQAGLDVFAKGPRSVEEAMKSSLLIERSAYERNLIILSTLGNNAPFIGLLGTVLGVIKAFNDLGVQGSSGVSVVMAGISSALIATAFGILLAIPAVIANNYFHTRLKKSMTQTQSLIHLLQVYLNEENTADLSRTQKSVTEGAA